MVSQWVFLATIAAGSAVRKYDSSVQLRSQMAKSALLDKLPGMTMPRAPAEILPAMQSFQQQMNGEALNPATITALESVISMLGEVSDEVELRFGNVQQTLDERIGALSANTDTAIARFGTAQIDDGSYVQAVFEEKGALVNLENQLYHQAELVEDEATKRQLEEDARMLTLVPPVLSTFSCDESASSCVAGLENYIQNIQQQFDAMSGQVLTHVSNYNSAKATYDNAVFDREAQDAVVVGAQTAFGTSKTTRMGAFTDRNVAICSFGDALEVKCASKSAFEELRTSIDADSGAYSLKAMKDDFHVAKATSCMLTDVKNDVVISAATYAACEDTFDFNNDVGVLELKEDTFRDLTETPSKHMCVPDDIAFSNEGWAIPEEGEDVHSSLYKKLMHVTFTPDLDLSTPPFPMCQ